MKHHKIKKDTVLAPGDELVIDGELQIIKEVFTDLLLLENNKTIKKESLLVEWDIEIIKDMSDKNNPELEISIVKKSKIRASLANERKIVLFSEKSNISLTRTNIDLMITIGNKMVQYFNEEQIKFER